MRVRVIIKSYHSLVQPPLPDIAIFIKVIITTRKKTLSYAFQFFNTQLDYKGLPRISEVDIKKPNKTAK